MDAAMKYDASIVITIIKVKNLESWVFITILNVECISKKVQVYSNSINFLTLFALNLKHFYQLKYFI